MAISYTAIQTLLDTQLATISTLPTLYTENERSTAQTNKNFSRSTLIPAKTDVLTVGSAPLLRLKGLYQIDVFLPQGKGTASNSIADDVLNGFPAALQLTDGTYTVQIESVERIAGSIFQQFYNVPVMVHWTCFVQNQ